MRSVTQRVSVKRRVSVTQSGSIPLNGRRSGISAPRRTAAMVSIGLALTLTLAACTGGTDTAPPASPAATSPSTEADAAQPTAEPAPTLQPEASAADNQAFFDLAAATRAGVDGRAFVDALVANGFDKTQMEVTFDRTHVDLAADTIQFSVRFNGECLIGQDGPASGGYHSAVTPLLSSGTCLVGTTRQIDW